MRLSQPPGLPGLPYQPNGVQAVGFPSNPQPEAKPILNIPEFPDTKPAGFKELVPVPWGSEGEQRSSFQFC